jgi:iron complex transport system ATP-binding protein
MISLENAGFVYPTGTKALDEVSAQVDTPELVAIVGPNGSGKSTLLDIVAGLKNPSRGQCRIQGRPAGSYSRSEFCRVVAHVPQEVAGPVPFTVEEVVLTGRTPFLSGFFESPEDVASAEAAMRRTGVDIWRNRAFRSLSGGERQRVLLAAAICQQPSILLLDEPGSHLDPGNEVWLWATLRDLRREGCAVLIVTHHLSLAARHSDRVWLLNRGSLVADGTPDVALHPDRLTDIFQVPFFRHVGANQRTFLGYGD